MFFDGVDLIDLKNRDRCDNIAGKDASRFNKRTAISIQRLQYVVRSKRTP